MRKIILASLIAVITAVPAFAADGIEGMWQRPANKGGALERISACGGAFCVTVASGEHSGKSAGKFTMTAPGKYKGTLTDISANKTYNGKATLTGNSLKMSGCVMGGLICSSEIWSRQ